MYGAYEVMWGMIFYDTKKKGEEKGKKKTSILCF
jgi:hypothetical protein